MNTISRETQLFDTLKREEGYVRDLFAKEFRSTSSAAKRQQAKLRALVAYGQSLGAYDEFMHAKKIDKGGIS